MAVFDEQQQDGCLMSSSKMAVFDEQQQDGCV